MSRGFGTILYSAFGPGARLRRGFRPDPRSVPGTGERAAHRAVPVQRALTFAGSPESVTVTVNVRV